MKARCSSATMAGRVPDCCSSSPPCGSPPPQSSRPPTERSTWQIVVAARRPRRRRLAVVRHSRLFGRRQMPAGGHRLCGSGGRRRAGHTTGHRGAEQRPGGCRWPVPALGLPLVISGFLVDLRADHRGPRGPRPYRRLQAISLDHRARAARPHDRARGHARDFREISALRDRARRREPLGRPLRRRPRRGGRGARRPAGLLPGTPAAATRGTIRPASSNSVGSSLASTISSASTAPGISSGSGGGGSSGGGGGGGGGGGW